MLKFVEAVESFLVRALIVMMILAILFATLDLAWILLLEVFSPPYLLLNVSKMIEVFGFFMMILIGIELLHSIKMYLSDHHLRVETVFMVAMIAIARKAIVMDLHELEGIKLIGLAATIIALAGGYFLVKRADRDAPPPRPDGAQDTKCS